MKKENRKGKKYIKVRKREASSDNKCKKKGKVQPKVKDDPKGSAGGKPATAINIPSVAASGRVSCSSDQWEQLMDYVQ